MVVIPREEPRQRAGYSQSIDELLGAVPPPPLAISKLTAQPLADPSEERTPPAAGLRATDRPATRHGSRSGSNTIGTASSTSSSVVNSSASSTTFSSSEVIVRTAASSDQSRISSRLGSAGPASCNMNVWSRDDDEAADSKCGAAAIAHDNEAVEESEPESHSEAIDKTPFSKRLQESTKRSLPTVALTPIDDLQARRSLTKVPSVILERNESSASIRSENLAQHAAATPIGSEASKISPKLPSESKTPTSEQSHNQEDQDHQDQYSKQNQDTVVIIPIAGERRKWHQPSEDTVNGGPSVDSTADPIMKPTPQIRSRTISTAGSTKPITVRTSSNEKLHVKPNPADVLPFVSRFSGGAMTPNGSGDDSQPKAALLPKSAKLPPKSQPPISSAQKPNVPSAPSASRKSPATKNTNGNLPFKSMLPSQSRAQSVGGGFELWLKQKAKSEQEKRRKLEQQKVDDEQSGIFKRKAEKKRDAERCFERWRAEHDAALAAERQKLERQKRARERKEHSAKEEKKKDAERTFEHWRKTHLMEMERRRTHSASAEHRRADDLSKKAAAKKEEAERAYSDWLRDKREKQVAAEMRIREAEQLEADRKKAEAEYKQQLSKEAYNLWLRLKHEERKYSKSLAYKILEFEAAAQRRWPSTPWLPTGNTVARRFVGGRQRRMTLERPVHLRHSRGATAASRPARTPASTRVVPSIVSRARSLH